MSPAGEDWQPTAAREAREARADLLATVRSFFAERGVLEVETPLLGAATATDPHIESLQTESGLYLQTSPEHAMKRLVAAGSGPIYQICRAFRAGEAGRRHNPEFTMLEWYRPGWDHHRLMDEVSALLTRTLGAPEAERASYRELFERHLGLDPHRAPAAALRGVAAEGGLEVEGLDPQDRDGWLEALLSFLIEPRLGRGRPLLVYDFPASQAALARTRRDWDGEVAERFEAYAEGVELANGFHELTDPGEQRRRFEADLARRRELGFPAVPLDERLLAALQSGMPTSAGVALGLDRLLMVALGARSLDEVLAFPIDRA